MPAERRVQEWAGERDWREGWVACPEMQEGRNRPTGQALDGPEGSTETDLQIQRKDGKELLTVGRGWGVPDGGRVQVIPNKPPGTDSFPAS